jgi:abortive infection bacteriophage resistance protein
MKTAKVFKSLDEQVKILQNRGLVITDKKKAEETLFRENYFFMNGYRHLFVKARGDNRFLEGTTFEELYAVFLFDRDIRNVMFKYILIMENNMKSTMSYMLSKKYGYIEKAYLNPKHYTRDALSARQVKDVLNKMKRQIRVNGDKHTATKHYMSKYGYIPLWILVKVLSLGIVSEYYSILRTEDKINIANIYDLDTETLSIYLTLLSNFRNVCAHEDILYMHRTQKVIPDCKYHRLLDIEMIDEEYVYGKNDLFALIIIMKQMLRQEDFTDLMNELGYEVDLLDGRVDVVPLEAILNKIGFPSNWRDIKSV